MKVSDFKSEDDLNKMKVVDIKKHVRDYNEHYKIAGYSKLKKDQIINMILTAQNRIRNASKSTAPAPAPAPAPTNTQSKPAKRIDLGIFRTSALLPLLNRKGNKEKYWLKNEGETFAKDKQRGDLEKRAKEFKKTATPEEVKAIDMLVEIHNTAVNMAKKGTFKNFGFYNTIMRNKNEINKTLKEAKLKGLPRD